MMYSVFRRYLQARDVVRPITFAVVSANLINFAGNWLLMYGNWGAPRLGLTGSGISTALSRTYIALVLAIALLLHERRSGYRHVPHGLAAGPGAHPPARRAGHALGRADRRGGRGVWHGQRDGGEVGCRSRWPHTPSGST